jgi:hypothetical protein
LVIIQEMPERLLLTYKVEAEQAPPDEEEQVPPVEEEEAPKPIEATVTEVVSATPPAPAETVDNTGDLLVSSIIKMMYFISDSLGVDEVFYVGTE